MLEPELWDEVQGRSPGIKPEPSPRKVCWCAGPCDCRRLVSKVKRDEMSFAPKWQWGTSEGLPPGFAQRCRTWTPKQDKLEEHIDLVISLGGDGTLCWTSGLFSGAMPPIIAFAAGSLGFLTPFPLSDWMSVLMPILGTKSEARLGPVVSGCFQSFRGFATPPRPHSCSVEMCWVGASKIRMQQITTAINRQPFG